MTDAAPLETIVEDGVRAFGVPGLAVAVTDRRRGVVSEESFTRMITPASEIDENGWGYGYGLAVQESSSRLMLGHNGASPGFTASLDLDMTAGIGVIARCNLTDLGTFAPAPIAEALRRVAVAHLEGKKPPEPPVWPEFEQAAPTEGEPPAEWKPYVGHYRSHSPWSPGFHVLFRGGILTMQLPSFEEVALTATGDRTFRVAHEIEGPAAIEFGDLIEGKAARATCDGVDLYRVGW